MKTIFMTILLSGIFLSGCEKYLDQKPQDSVTEAIYFENPSQFEAAANYLYSSLEGFGANFLGPWDPGTDLSGNFGTGDDMDYARGSLTVPTTIDYWDDTYEDLRKVNQLIEKAAEYKDSQSGIAVSLGTAHFFRAWHYFMLMKRYGGVPLITHSLDIDSEELYGKRSSRYEVFDQIISDLNMAISLGLPSDAAIPTGSKGKISIEAAKSLKAIALLYEATWEKYVGTDTDGDGTSSGAGSTKPAGYPTITTMLTDAKATALDVMNNGPFELWDKRTQIVENGDPVDYNHLFYLFCLEDAQSNPAGLTKADNKEFIFYNVYDYVLKKANSNLNHSKPCTPSRKLMDMYLCTDGLPVQYSPLFQGYSMMASEFRNRDLRVTAFVSEPLKQYWGRGAATDGGGAQYDKTFATSGINFDYRHVPQLIETSVTRNYGYEGRKFTSEHIARENQEESYNYPYIRLAEVILTYAEATCELGNGAISDADLNLSVNKIRFRSGVAPLTNALIAPYSDLTMLGEIRRERAIELFGEGKRMDDIKRWGIAIEELNIDHCTVYIAGTEFETAINPKDPTKTIYMDVWPYGLLPAEESVSSYAGFVSTKAGALVLDAKIVRNFKIKDYLWPLSTDEIKLNPNFLQNPGW
ncbi:MAG TPA: RagB/SusD family nutrient uptake outer membrane protein [Bacteroidales bacterium]|nr:RagB/SusD family nutrient uptake outer membrane protein [Bacteroidales bacterium]